jgi:dynein heavy chain
MTPLPSLLHCCRFSPSGTYITPECETVREFVDHVRGYPIQPAPEIFGLHKNADITCDQGETYALLGTLLTLQPRVTSGGRARAPG